MENVACTDPRWADAAMTTITCTVDFFDEIGPRPFNAMAMDPEPRGRALWAELNAGVYGLIAAYVPPPPRTGKGPRALG